MLFDLFVVGASRILLVIVSLLLLSVLCLCLVHF